ncbi:MAG: MBL fold metallo-hydrolase [Burkholderiales bacterium]|nr:MBL fold metallo-hydrolase [Burkholderiales bacterium]
MKAAEPGAARGRARAAQAGVCSLHFLGATGTVTGSKTLVAGGGARVLVDCGLFQGYKALRLRNRAPLPVPPDSLSAVILTHAHIDHSGYLPLLARNGFAGPVYCSEATRELCAILLPDAGRLQEEEADYANRKGFSRHRPALPLYTEKDAIASLALLRPTGFESEFDIGGLRAHLVPAGHILGASMVSLRLGGRRLLFTGDLGRAGEAIMYPPSPVRGADYLVLESTYGDRVHPAGDPRERLAEVIVRTASRGGVVVIPSFAVGRAQSLLYAIHTLKAQGRIPAGLPVYLNSPMAADVTAIYRRRHEEHRLDAGEAAALGRAAVLVNTVEDSRRLNTRAGPMVIIAASGMATGGRVVHHLKAFAPDARNTILFSGFQAGGTRGATMLSGADSVKIHGQYVPIRAEVQVIDNFSAHADQAEILAWLSHFERAPRETFIVHGEPGAADGLRRRIEEVLRWRVCVPEYLQRVALWGKATIRA